MPTSAGGARYWLTFTDDFTRETWIYFMKEKSESLQKLQKFVAWIQCQSNQKVKRLRSNNEGEYNNKKSHAWFKETRIQWEPTVPYAPDQNEVSKKTNRTLMERVQSVLYAKNLDKTLWAKIAKTVIYLKNWSPTTCLYPQEKLPHEAWYKNKSNLSHLCILRCITYVHTSKELRRKLDSHSRKCILVGYMGSNIYRLWDPEKTVVIRGWDVIFNKRFHHTHPTINQATREVIIEPSLTTQAQPLRIDDTVTTNNIDLVGAQLESIKLIETEEQQMTMTTQPQILQLIQRTL